jgi:hypothetical protein
MERRLKAAEEREGGPGEGEGRAKRGREGKIEDLISLERSAHFMIIVMTETLSSRSREGLEEVYSFPILFLRDSMFRKITPVRRLKKLPCDARKKTSRT